MNDEAEVISELEPTKLCNTCKRKLPATSQYFFRWRYSKDGLRSTCKECQGYNFVTKETLPEGYRRCSRCKGIFPETEEYFLRYWDKRCNKFRFKSHCLECGKKGCKEWRQTGNPERYREYYMAYQMAYRDIIIAKAGEWRHNHPEVVKERKKRYRSNPENIEKIRAYNRMRRAMCPEHLCAMSKRWREKSKDRIKEYNKQYVQSHKDYFVQAVHKRNARIQQLPATLTQQEWEEAKAEFNYKCAYCGQPTDRLTQDHVIPVSKGGGYTKINIIPACKSCNSSKHTTPLLEWYKRQTFYSEDRYEHIAEYLQRAAENGVIA